VKFEYKLENILRGGLVYAAGDCAAAILLDEFSVWRLLGMALVGATVYALEVPNYFNWIESKVKGRKGLRIALLKTGLAMLYFNPLWVARHLFFIRLFSGSLEGLDGSLLLTAVYSFAANIPVSLIGNYLIQNVVRLRWRFLASALFSALMALYYALSAVWF
jgi:hypothetical protein